MSARHPATQPSRPSAGAAMQARGVGSIAWEGRLANAAAFAFPIALVGGLALAGGGFELSARHVAGGAAWGVVILLIALGAASKVSFGRPAQIAVGLILAYAVLSAISSSWSGAPERSVIEADRVLAYLGFFIAAWLLAQTSQTAQRFAEGLAIAATLIALLALTSRLLPGILTVADDGGERLSYPLQYWNAEGVVFGISFTLLTWMSRRGTNGWLRFLAVAAMPATLLALFFTYSRGGAAAGAAGLVLLLALSRDRLWYLAISGLTALCATPAILAALDRRDLLDHISGNTAQTQGLEVLGVLVAGSVVAVLSWQALVIVEDRKGARTSRAVEASRNPKLLGGVGILAITITVVAALLFGGKAYDRFSSPDIQFPDQPEKHFSQISGAGRHDFWRVAVDTFSDHPLAGRGAGTYELAWEQGRSINMVVVDAHSLYFEAFAELGLIGGTLILALIAWLFWIGFMAWAAAEGATRERCAVLLAIMAAFAVSAGLDWSWEMAGLGVLFFLSAGVLLAVRSSQLAAAEDPETRERHRSGYGIGIGGLALAWVSILALAMPWAVQREITASQNAAARGDIPSAVSKAENARMIEPWAASPYTQLGLLSELEGEYPTGIDRLTQAIDRDDSDWLLFYTRARMYEEAGDLAAARADIARARMLNPLASELQAGDPVVQGAVPG